MVRRIGIPLAFLALFLVAGGHWAVLQSVAWGRMVVEYSQKAGLQRGIGETFDGDHPCPLCLQVEKGKQEERQAPAAVVPAKKGDPFLCAAAATLFRPPGRSFSWPRREFGGASRSDRPPVPPPPSLLS